MKMFSGKRYFNDIFWAPANNNNTLPDTGISSNKIYKYKEPGLTTLAENRET
jgi:hypothetical protein